MSIKNEKDEKIKKKGLQSFIFYPGPKLFFCGSSQRRLSKSRCEEKYRLLMIPQKGIPFSRMFISTCIISIIRFVIR